MIDDDLRRLLHDAVPDLPAPADRLSAVAARVRRTRRRAAAGGTVAAVVAVALAVGVPTLLARPTDAGPEPAAATPAPAGPPPSPVPLDQGGCPAVAAPPPSDEDRPGPLVRTGATQVTLCERLTEPHAASFDPRAGQPRTLTIGVEQITALLNELPDKETMLGRLREQARQRGENPANLEMGCTLIGFPSELSLVLRYRDGTTTVVWLDRNCGSVRADGRTRYDYSKVFDLFLRLYRDQLAAQTRPADIPAPTCPPVLTPEESFGGPATTTEPLTDEIARNRGSKDGFLPSPLAKATVCRYARAAGGEPAALTRSVTLEVSEGLRELLNTATTVRTSTGARGTSTLANGTDCADPANLGSIRVLDLVRVADVTGAVADVAVLRTPCGAVVRSGGLVPTPDLLGLLDAHLGPVR